LDKYKIYESSKSLKVREDLFGDRIFPVIKVPSNLLYENGYVYFDIRGKANKIDLNVGW